MKDIIYVLQKDIPNGRAGDRYKWNHDEGAYYREGGDVVHDYLLAAHVENSLWFKPETTIKCYTSEVKAIDPKSGEMKTWPGMLAHGETQEEAQASLDKGGFGYCKITGEWIDPSKS